MFFELLFCFFYAGSGWDTDGDAELAKAAAARAREYAQWRDVTTR